MRYYFSIILLIFVISSSLFADSLIKTHDNKYYSGKIIEEDKLQIQLKTDEGVSLKIPKESIDEITPLLYEIRTSLGSVYVGYISSEDDKSLNLITEENLEIAIPKESIEVKTIAKKHVALMRSSFADDSYSHFSQNIPFYYPEEFGVLGLSFGTPGVLNLHIGYQTEELGFAIIGGLGGLELDASVRLKTTKRTFLNLNAVAGYSVLDYLNNGYGGLKCTYAYKFIFIEGGLVLDSRYYELNFLFGVGAFIHF